MRINNLGNIQTAIEFQKADAQITTVASSTPGGDDMKDGQQVATKYLAKVPTDPKGGVAFKYGANTNDTTATTYQVAASLEALADAPTSLGSYNLNTARAAVVGTFLPVAKYTIAPDTGVITASSTGAISLISASGTTLTEVTATGVVSNATLDNGDKLPY